MKLHIVIPVLNCLDLTKQALASIKASQGFTIHLIDQSSTDGTREWGQEQDFYYKRFEPKVSLSEAWNHGIEESLKDGECEYIFIPNNDVIFHKTTIDNLIRGIDELGYAMVTGENVASKMSLSEMLAGDKWGDWEFDSKPIGSWREEGPDFSCFMIGRDFVSKYGWFDENFYPAYCEDQDMHIRIMRAGGHAKRLSTAPYFHYASQTIVKNPNIAPETHEGHYKNLAYYREKWGFDHAVCMSGDGFERPYNSDKDIKYWRGCEKYEGKI